MTPFDINPDNDAGHAIDQDDLIAFHLHDLPSSQERAVRRVLHTNPTLQAESLAIASTLRAFPKHEPTLPLDPATLDRHWHSLRNSLPPYTPPPATPFSFFPRWAFPTLAASAIAAAAILFTLHHKPHTTSPTLANNASPSSATATAPASTPAQHFPILADPHPPFSTPHRSSTPNTPSQNKAASPLLTASVANSSNPLSIPSPASAPPSQTTVTSPSLTSPSNTMIATTHQSPSVSTAPPLTPTFTPIIQTRGHVRSHYDLATDVTLAVLGNFTPARSFTATQGTGSDAVTSSLSQTTTPAFGVLASLHQQFRPWAGYRATASYSQPTFEYTDSLSADSSSGNIVDVNAYELSGTYVVAGPHHHRFSSDAEAGAGLLALLPASPNRSTVPIANAYRPAAVFGASAEFTLSRHLALHAGYRALIYKGPSAVLTDGSTLPSTPSNLTLSSEPVIGLTYRFHQATE